jgi:hypothetical protein
MIDPIPIQKEKSRVLDQEKNLIILSRDNNSCPSQSSPTKASNPLPHKGFQVLRSQLVQNERKIKSVRRFGRN